MTVRLARSDADGVGVPDAAEAEIVFPKTFSPSCASAARR